MFCTVEDMVEQFGEDEMMRASRKPTDPHGQVNTEKIRRAITQAAAEIQPYLQGRYPSLSVIPEVLRGVAMDIARYLLNTRVDEDSPIVARYKDRKKFLVDVSRGIASLGVDENNNTVEAADDLVMVSAGRSDFGGRNW